jgi:hypothetical protein
MKQLLIFLTVMLLASSAMAMPGVTETVMDIPEFSHGYSAPTVEKKTDGISFLGSINYQDKMGVNIGFAIPMPGSENLYILTEGAYSELSAGIGGRLAYLSPVKNWIFVGATAGLNNNWIKYDSEDVNPTAYFLTGTGLFVGKSWDKIGIFIHWEYQKPLDEDAKIEGYHNFNLGCFINLF